MHLVGWSPRPLSLSFYANTLCGWSSRAAIVRSASPAAHRSRRSDGCRCRSADVGQTDARVQFVSRSNGFRCSSRGAETVVTLRKRPHDPQAALRMTLTGARRDASATPLEPPGVRTLHRHGSAEVARERARLQLCVQYATLPRHRCRLLRNQQLMRLPWSRQAPMRVRSDSTSPAPGRAASCRGQTLVSFLARLRIGLHRVSDGG